MKVDGDNDMRRSSRLLGKKYNLPEPLDDDEGDDGYCPDNDTEDDIPLSHTKPLRRAKVAKVDKVSALLHVFYEESEEHSEPAEELEDSSRVMQENEQQDIKLIEEVFAANDGAPVALQYFQQKNLSATKLKLSRIVAEVKMQMKRQDPKALQQVATFLANFNNGRQRMSAGFALDLSRIWSLLNMLTRKLDIRDWDLMLSHQQLMLSAAAAWYWLDHSCMEHCAKFLAFHVNTSLPPTDWLSALTMAVYTHLSTGDSVDLNPTSFIPGLDNMPSYLLSTFLTFKGKKLQVRTLRLVYIIVRQWLSYPNNTYLAQGAFVYRLVDTFQTQRMLLLEGVWHAFSFVKKAVLNTPSMRHSSIRVNMLDGFFKKLQELPILTPHSSEYNTFKDIIGDAERCVTSHRKTKPAPSNPSPNVHPVPIASSSTPSTYSPELHRLLKFVKDLLPLCLETSPSSPTCIQAHILKDLDKFFPFREHAPTKLSVSGPNGPLHPDNINKPGGFASVLCWCGVTFGCKAAVEKEVFFPDLEAFQAMCRSCPSDDPKFLCKKTAYGSAIGGRGPEHAPAYFAAEKEWKKLFDDPSMVDANGQLGFTIFYQWTHWRPMSCWQSSDA
ncbi:hypothetical protein SCP_0802490 [Sparassis crispa]|uniref:Uncharacterized protein n=1 Tax=Sparassis crispa TaxID=139825 RepID=A0A401GU35_9APHY|nr:hypothetical protein SCP_0802490 [Sparassis crispa]GBE85727.1 hypothetical protein SCP_0802490 [Sparassis crispa]